MLGAIWAQNLNRIIGDGLTMPWHVPEDMRFFKEQTLNHTVIMGRKTWESLSVRPLPHRENIIISSREPGAWSQGARVIHDLAQLPDRGWIIGGGEIYRQTLPQVGRIVRTLIDADIEVGEKAVLAPEIPQDFRLTDHTDWTISRSGQRYCFQTWDRIATEIFSD
ncbi:dihydrofolate reductase [Corynebacterium sp. ES2794-CONJ1]|uniref:dihydrofolate reductase n=1 Tax=unclassified Corynebacterium TaxID=2624378 RepID=UPI0021676DD1|nr:MULTISPECIES: dihydrofolate reductase [unclassified Corynebacterium]MCS4491595.1 dihydrofolate reductase [Corynebacterium sp. ES2715-CONJ3]MCU9519095.1 dihydrofolate reductase [Corynebacterium sp. ES2794-CONJ1]